MRFVKTVIFMIVIITYYKRNYKQINIYQIDTLCGKHSNLAYLK